MKKLSQIAIILEPTFYARNSECFKGFSYSAFSIGNFLSREVLKPLKWEAPFRLLCIRIDDELEDCVQHKSHLNSLGVNLKVDLQKTRRALATEAGRFQFQIDFLKKGINMAKGGFNLPTVELLSGISDFQNGGYINQWIYKKRKIRSLGIEVHLKCSLTQTEFTLDLELFDTKTKDLVWTKGILSTAPDSICYHHKFDKILLDDEKLMVEARGGGNILFSLSLKQISRLLHK